MTKRIYTIKNIDPIEFIKTEVHNEYAKARMLSYASWMIDNVLTRQLSNLFFALHRDVQENGGTGLNGKSIDTYNDFLKAMSVREAREANLYDQGFMETSGVKAIRQLLLLRIDWHDAAADLRRNMSVSADQHQPYPTVEQLLRNQRLQETDSRTRAKFQALAEYDAGDKATPEQIQEYFDAYMLRDKQMHEERFTRAKERVDALVGMADFVDHTNTLSDVTFCDLPDDIRRTLVEAAVRACDVGVKELISNRKVEVEEMVPGKKLLQASKAVLEALVVKFDEPALGRQHSGTESEFEDARLNKPGMLGTHGNPSPAKHDARQEIAAAQ